MLSKLLLTAAAASLAATPCAAAGLERSSEVGERKSGAVAGFYWSIPFGGKRSGKSQAGLRLQATHDYRHASAPSAPVIQADAFDLRLIGDRHATLYVADVPVTGEEARKHNFAGGSLLTIGVLALAAVGAIVVFNAISDADDDQCFEPTLCD